MADDAKDGPAALRGDAKGEAADSGFGEGELLNGFCAAVAGNGFAGAAGAAGAAEKGGFAGEAAKSGFARGAAKVVFIAGAVNGFFGAVAVAVCESPLRRTRCSVYASCFSCWLEGQRTVRVLERRGQLTFPMMSVMVDGSCRIFPR